MSFTVHDIVVSTIAYIVAAILIKRQFDQFDFPPGRTRTTLILTLALGASYVVQAGYDWILRA